MSIRAAVVAEPVVIVLATSFAALTVGSLWAHAGSVGGSPDL
ncbi:hypothetical protein ABDZ15_12270 [Mycobacterium canetti]